MSNFLGGDMGGGGTGSGGIDIVGDGSGGGGGLRIGAVSGIILLICFSMN